MKEFIDKLIEKLEEEPEPSISMGKDYIISGNAIPKERVVEIVNELAEEYNNGWISADVELPTKNGWYWGYYVTASYIGTDGVKHIECKYSSIYWEDNLWLYDPRSFRTVDEVIAWKPIAPYTEGE